MLYTGMSAVIMNAQRYTLLTVVICGLIVLQPVSGKKPYEILLDKFEPFSKTGLEFFDPGTLRISRKGRNNFVFSGDFELMKNFGDEVMVKYTSSKKGLDGKFSPLMAGESPICKQIQDDDKYYPIICKSSNLPTPAPCPFPKGKYNIDNFKLDENFLPAIMPAGDYMSLVTFMKDGNELFGYKMYITIK